MSEIKENENKKECKCNIKNELLWKWFFRALVLTIFIMACITTHYVLKLWQVWQVVERLPQT